MRIVLHTIFCLLGVLPLKAQQADAILGDWLTENNEARVHIYVENGKYYGKITTVKDGKESAKINTLVLSDFVYNSKDKEWNNGTVHDPRHGHKASGYLVLKNSNTLKVVGYKALRWISDSEIWVRADQ
ncbi:MAG TPA: DUF2147 domain-containing protein [Cyclobacteriaceae bacterium]|nr:DUF2147 domain-containing protein [Cyclobacteriaceae bacterium]HRJ80930.1 DUF2147 domain-containing protein [Cyclobacteriaceae bacterium]